MKKPILIRILAALGGVTLGMLGLCALAETFFSVPVTAHAGRLLGAGTPLAVLITLLAALLLCAMGVCCLLMLSTRRAAKRKGFVMQKGENGMIGVSVKSIEGLVQTCVRQHDEVASAEIAVVEKRDGIVILLNLRQAAGVNIPLAVGALQKQIRQYVNECTGVDVHEVRVMVENTDNGPVESPYAVKEPVVLTTAVTAAEMRREAPAAPVAEPPVEPAPAVEAPVAPVAEEEPVEAFFQEEAAPAEPAPAVSAPVAAPAPMPEIIEEADARPLHQRLFGAEDQPAFVPMPPEMIAEPAAEIPVEAAPAEPGEEPIEEPAEEPVIASEIEGDAVLEVVKAIGAEETLPEQDEPIDEEDGEIRE